MSGEPEFRSWVFMVAHNRVVAVEYVDRTTGDVRSLPVRGVALAAGAIDTTMILLRSTSTDFPDGLGNTNDLIGKYLHDHPREWWPATLDRPMRALAHPLYLARRPHADSTPLFATSLTIGLAARRDRLRTYVRGSSDAVGVQVFGTMVPQPDRGVAIDRAETPSVGQRPIVRLAYDTEAVTNIHESRTRITDEFAEVGLGVKVDGPFHDLQPGSSVHMAGTVRMHADPEFGVEGGHKPDHVLGRGVVRERQAQDADARVDPNRLDQPESIEMPAGGQHVRVHVLHPGDELRLARDAQPEMVDEVDRVDACKATHPEAPSIAPAPQISRLVPVRNLRVDSGAAGIRESDHGERQTGSLSDAQNVTVDTHFATGVATGAR